MVGRSLLGSPSTDEERANLPMAGELSKELSFPDRHLDVSTLSDESGDFACSTGGGLTS